MNKNNISIEEAFQIAQELWACESDQKEPEVYAILDGSRDSKIERLINSSGMRHSCLYEGKLNYDLATAAPYIVRLELDEAFTIELIQQAWGNSWGIFAIAHSPTTMATIRRNCRKIAFVRNENNKKLLFRYYDPRVLRNYLPTCSPEDAERVFGSVFEFFVESESIKKFHRFRQTKEGVVDAREVSISQFVRTEPAYRNNVKGLLKITSSQMAEFKRLRLEQFHLKMVQHLKSVFTQATAKIGDDKQLQHWVERNVKSAQSNGFETEQDICRYLNVAIVHGEEFFKTDWAINILNQEYFPSTKAMFIEEESTNQLKLQHSEIQKQLDDNKKIMLDNFYQTHQPKVSSIGRVLFELNFDDYEEEKKWIYNVGIHCLNQKLYDELEMDLWLDMSMRYGDNFYQLPWAIDIIDNDSTPQVKLQNLIKSQPHITQAKLS